MDALLHSFPRTEPAKVIRADGNEPAELTFRLLESPAELASIRDDWNDLSRQACGQSLQFQSWQLAAHWAKHYRNAKNPVAEQLYILAGYSNDTLVMLWPMVRQTQLGIRLLRWLGDPVRQYGDVLVRQGSDTRRWIAAGLDHLIGMADVDIIEFDGLRADGALAPVLKERGFTPAETDEALGLQLGTFSSLDDFRSSLSRKARRSRKRARRLLAEQGPVSFEVHGPGPQAAAAVERAFAFKADWLARRGRISRAFSDDRFRRFWTGLASDRQADNPILVSELTTANTTAAVEIGLVSEHHYIAHIGAFNPDLKTLSPGVLQMEETIGHLITAGIRTYDLLPPRDDYKKRWAKTGVDVHDVLIATSALGQGVAVLGLTNLRGRLKSGFQLLPAGLRRMVAAAMPSLAGRK